MLLLDDVDDADDDGLIDELDRKIIFFLNSIYYYDERREPVAGITYETVLFTLNTLTVPSEHVDASLLPNGLHSMSDTGVECSFSSHN